MLLLPGSVEECYQMAIDAFDLAERLQTVVFVMSDLDLGLNDHVTEPLVWDDARKYDRGKYLTSEELDRIGTGTLMAGVSKNSSDSGKAKHELSVVMSELDGQANSDHSTTAPLEQFKGKYGRYLDVDDDGIPYRTIPGRTQLTGPSLPVVHRVTNTLCIQKMVMHTAETLTDC